MMKNLNWLWQISSPVCLHEAVGMKESWVKAIYVQKRRISFVARALKLTASLEPYMHSRPGSQLQRALKQRPEIVGVVLWPYICHSWCARTRLNQIESHYKAIASINPQFDISVQQSWQVLNLEENMAGLRVVIDQPKWFMREGLLVINLFIAETRIYSLAFSFSYESGRLVAYIGAIQGVDTEGILEEYKNLTKALHGMRPRDFLLEAFRTLCRCAGVHRIYAVDDAKRQHRGEYYRGQAKSLFCDYNSIWMDRGGVRHDEDFFLLSVHTPVKSLEEIPSKKRAMFRRRYEFLQSIEERMQEILGKPQRKNNVIPFTGKRAARKQGLSAWLNSVGCFDAEFILTVASNI